jgi:hypothetical protein
LRPPRPLSHRRDRHLALVSSPISPGCAAARGRRWLQRQAYSIERLQIEHRRGMVDASGPGNLAQFS